MKPYIMPCVMVFFTVSASILTYSTQSSASIRPTVSTLNNTTISVATSSLPGAQGQLCSGLSLMEDRLLANDERKQDNITASQWQHVDPHECTSVSVEPRSCCYVHGLQGSRHGKEIWSSQLHQIPGMNAVYPNIHSSSCWLFSFEGIPVNFSFPEPKRIRKRICEKVTLNAHPYQLRFEPGMQYFDFLSDQDQDVKYCFGCHVAPYYCTVQSIWVYITKIKPLGDNDSDDEEW